MTLLPANSSLLELAIDHVAASLIDRITPPFPELMNARETPAAFLPYLAADRGVSQWELAATEAQKRETVAAAWEVKRLAGTRHAIKRALAAAGYDVLAIEGGASYQREWQSLGGQTLDGAWSLDGALELEPPAGSAHLLRSLPLDHWAKYSIRINTANGAWSRDQQIKIRELAEEHGPLRSELAAIVASLSARLGRPVQVTALLQRVRIRLDRCQRVQPLQRRTLDGCWSLGGEEAVQALDGSLQLDGNRQLDGARLLGTWNWAEGHARASQRVRVRLVATVGTGTAPEALALAPRFQLLDGNTSLAAHTLQGWPLDEGITLGDAGLDRIALHKLDGTWRLGARPAAARVHARITARIRQHGLTQQVAL